MQINLNQRLQQANLDYHLIISYHSAQRIISHTHKSRCALRTNFHGNNSPGIIVRWLMPIAIADSGSRDWKSLTVPLAPQITVLLCTGPPSLPDVDLFIARTDTRQTDTTYQPATDSTQLKAGNTGCGRRTDGQRDRHVAVAKTALCIASRG